MSNSTSFRIRQHSMLTIIILSSLLVACQTVSSTNTHTTTIATQNNKSDNHKGADAFAPEQGTGLTEQQQVYAKKYMVASGNPLATQAGYDILKRGGSAIDAMIAVQSTLGLVEPQSSGLGGGAFVVYWDNKNKKLTTFDGRETAPLAADEKLFLDSEGKPLKFMDAVVGGRSVGTPSIPLLMQSLHQRYGQLSWSSLFQQPIHLAEKGFQVSPRMAQSIEQNQDSLQRFSNTKDYFFPNGKALQAGQILKNVEYAQSLKVLAKQGANPFYQGQYAKNIIKAVTESPSNAGVLSLQDLQQYRIIERQPVCADYRQYQVCGMDAPSSGGIAVGQIVGMLNQFDTQQLAKPSAYSLRVLGDASRLAFADRDYYVADPSFVNVPSQALLSADYLKQRADLIKHSDKALNEVKAGQLEIQRATGKAIELPSTSHIVIVDAQGNVLSMTTSIENAFGSTVMANGYLLNNQLTDFSFEPNKDGIAVANRVEAGKRPRSSMSPTIVLKNGEPYMAVGSPGGSRIIGYVAKTLMAHVDWGMDIQHAITMPNVLNRFGNYELEQNSSATQYVEDLKALGYKTDVRDLNSGVQGIIIQKDSLIGGADPRREGKVMGD
ncbi:MULTISPECIES: gamma-glutamyltransferase [unclassified Acinetobacter]|uniref:gamma-glutamyltransferase n=1 Tax=unclassified Acinetobacter TaxID=196816 RepID=UPI0035B738E7